jgi:serine/threonine protein phosphatase PrpC
MIVEVFATTDNGQRPGQNEDNFAVCKDLSSKNWIFKPQEKINLSDAGALMLIADGMGGANAGEVASDLAQKVIQEEFNKVSSFPTTDRKRTELLKQVIHLAHNKLVKHQQQNLETAGMGTTVVILWVTLQKAYVAWCGDSRLYIHKKEKPLQPATDDHSYVWSLVKSGSITAEDARLHPESNIITQSLGDPTNPPNPEIRIFDIDEGDRFLLCSDGLNSMLPDSQIQEILSSEDNTLEASRMLIDAANAAGGKDNITVVLLDVRELRSQAGVNNTTKELRNYIKRKNKVIALLGIILFCVVSYMVFAKTLSVKPDTNVKDKSIGVKQSKSDLLKPTKRDHIIKSDATPPVKVQEVNHKNDPEPASPRVDKIKQHIQEDKHDSINKSIKFIIPKLIPDSTSF